MIKKIVLWSIIIIFLTNCSYEHYTGTWFELGQKNSMNDIDKYSGGLSTYTAKHIPVAIKSENKIFFTFGSQKENHLLNMVGEYDTRTKKFSKSTLVYEHTQNDPHENASIMIDDSLYIWVYVSGRASLKNRNGRKYRSKNPLDISEFRFISEQNFTYPQIWNLDSGYVFLYTKYEQGKRHLYYQTAIDPFNFGEEKLLVGGLGHYQVSGINGNKIGTFYNDHVNGGVDNRQNLNYIESVDCGKTWSKSVTIVNNGRNIYLKDAYIDSESTCLFTSTYGYASGINLPCVVSVAYFDNGKWHAAEICQTDHAYDTGCFLNKWEVVFPDIPGKGLCGGELSLWESDNGLNWERTKMITNNSERNNNYVRRVQNSDYFIWADGNPDKKSESLLYLGTKNNYSVMKY